MNRTALQPAIWTPGFTFVCVSSFFLFLSFYTMATTLPLFVEQSLHGGGRQVGLAMTVFVLAAVIFRPLAGRWCDTAGSRRVLLIGLAVFLTASAFYFGVHGIGMLLALRFVHGAGFGMAATAAGAAAAELVPATRKGEGIGYFSLFMSLAMVLGPFAGLTIVHAVDYAALFVMCGLFAALALLAGACARPNAARPNNSRPGRGDGRRAAEGAGTHAAAPQSPADMRDAAAGADKRPDAAASSAAAAVAAPTGVLRQALVAVFERRALPVALTGFVLAFSYSGITTFLSLYAGELSIGETASWFFICFALMIVVPRPFTGRLFDRYGANVLVYPGILLFTLGIALLSQAGSPALFLVSGAISGLGYGLLFPSFQTLAVQSSPASRGGIATSTYFVLFDSGYGVGSFLLGVIAARSHYSTMYLCSAAIVALTALLYYLLHHRRQKPRPAAAMAAGS